MGQASLAIFYVIFAILTIFINLESIGIGDANAIYRTIAHILKEDPSERSLDPQDPEELYFWMNSSLTAVFFGEQEAMSTRAAWGNVSSWNFSMTPATIGSFNRILLARFTFKHWAVERTAGQFQSSTPYKLAGGVSWLDPVSVNSAESKTELCTPGNRSTCFTWQTANSFEKAGGYTQFFDPMEGQEAFSALFSQMREAGLFNSALSSCTIDMIVYNANVEMFLQYVQSFSFDFSGHVHSTTDSRIFNLNVFNTSVGKYLTLYVMRVICVVMLLIFLLLEFRRMWDVGVFEHFQRYGVLTDMLSISFSLGVFISYWVIEQMPPFQSFDFQELRDLDTRAGTYVSLCDVARVVQLQGGFVALNLLVVSLRTVSLVSGLHSNLGLILKVIGVSLPNFAAFMVLFGVLQLGFVLTSFFAFGPGYTEMSTVGLCIYKSFSMLSGDMVFDQISRVDSILGPIYFFSFYILFYLVLINIFVTLLMSGYDLVDYELQKKAKPEKNPILLIYEELKADIVGSAMRYGGTAFRLLGLCMNPILVSIQACCCFSPPRLERFREQRARTATLADRQFSEQEAIKFVDPRKKKRRNLLEFVTMITFMTVWIVLMTLQGRGQDSYFAGQATLAEAALAVPFGESHRSFGTIQSFADVKAWAETAIVGLYNDPTCVESKDGHRVWGSCAKAELNRVAAWNIGFLNTTFVRLTLQPACFTATGSEWAMRTTPDVSCWNSVCTELSDCRTADGQMLDSLENVSASGKLGPFRQLGGIAFSLGVTKEECQSALTLLDEKRWFSENAASMVFDWLSYNGNLDMFTHNVVAFSLLETGMMHRFSESKTFPLNIEAGGGYFDLQVLVLVLFGVYALLLLFHIGEMAWEVRAEFMSSRIMQKPFKSFLLDFASESWRIVEFLSLSISLATVITFLVFMLNGFRTNYRFSLDESKRYVVPNDEVMMYNLSPVLDPMRPLEDDWYFFKQFENLQDTYGTFLHLAALNSLFIAVKAIRSVSGFDIVSKFSKTLANGKSRNLYFIIVINLQMSGFALAMTVIFGTLVEDFSSPLSTMGALLFWVCGSSDLGPLLQVRPVAAVLFFVAFTIIFRFISTNMFLATQLNTFASLVGERDIQAARQEVNAKIGVRHVRYRSGMELREELQLERQDDQVIVKAILKPGRALRAHVKAGDVVSKVNNIKVDWQRTLGDEEYQHIERTLMPEGDGSITISVLDPPRKSLLQRARLLCMKRKVKPGRSRTLQAYAKPPSIRPSVHNFWRFHGAVAEVERNALLSEEDASGSELSHLEQTPKAQEAPADARGEIKKRLHGHLFSRWPGTRAKTVSNAIQVEVTRSEGLLEDDVLQDSWDVDEMKEALEQMPITGQEVWLDCLLLALEEEVLEESPIVEVLRTNGLQDVSRKRRLKGAAQEKLLTFYRRLDQVLSILENKAYKCYFQNLLLESEQRQQLVQKQNEVLHDYACELEKEFSDTSQTIQKYKAKKDLMLSKLAGLLDQRDFPGLRSS